MCIIKIISKECQGEDGSSKGKVREKSKFPSYPIATVPAATSTLPHPLHLCATSFFLHLPLSSLFWVSFSTPTASCAYLGFPTQPCLVHLLALNSNWLRERERSKWEESQSRLSPLPQGEQSPSERVHRIISGFHYLEVTPPPLTGCHLIIMCPDFLEQNIFHIIFTL